MCPAASWTRTAPMLLAKPGSSLFKPIFCAVLYISWALFAVAKFVITWLLETLTPWLLELDLVVFFEQLLDFPISFQSHLIGRVFCSYFCTNLRLYCLQCGGFCGAEYHSDGIAIELETGLPLHGAGCSQQTGCMHRRCCCFCGGREGGRTVTGQAAAAVVPADKHTVQPLCATTDVPAATYLRQPPGYRLY